MSETVRGVMALALAIVTQLFAPATMAQSASAEDVLPKDDSATASTVTTKDSERAPEQRFTFVVRARAPGARIDVHSEAGELVAQCVQRCELHLARGEYRAAERTQDGDLLRDLEFTVVGPGGIEIQEPDTVLSNTGLALAIVGMALIPTGAEIAARAFSTDSCPAGSDCRSLGTVGLGMFVAGLVLTPVGWVVFGKHHGAQVHQYGPTDINVAAAPSRGGATFGIAGRF